MKRRAELQEADGNIDNENTKDISFKTRTPACLEQEGIQPARYSSVLPPHLPCTISAFSPHAPSLPFVQSLDWGLRDLGTGDRRWGKGARELVPAQHFGAGLPEPGGEEPVLLSSHRAQMSNGCGARSQPPDLNS